VSGAERSGLLSEASSLVGGDRNRTYGEPIDDYTKVAGMWNAYLTGVLARLGVDLDGVLPLEPHDAIAMMVLVKVARIANDAGHRDNWVDLAGYAACGWDAWVDGQARLAPRARPAETSTVDRVAELHAEIGRLVGGYND
jgi:hypothetical protein